MKNRSKLRVASHAKKGSCPASLAERQLPSRFAWPVTKSFREKRSWWCYPTEQSATEVRASSRRPKAEADKQRQKQLKRALLGDRGECARCRNGDLCLEDGSGIVDVTPLRNFSRSLGYFFVKSCKLTMAGGRGILEDQWQIIFPR